MGKKTSTADGIDLGLKRYTFLSNNAYGTPVFEDLQIRSCDL